MRTDLLDHPSDTSPPSPSTPSLPANHFFEFTQKEISCRAAKNFGALLVSKRRSSAAEMMAVSDARRQAKKYQKKPEKYILP